MHAVWIISGCIMVKLCVAVGIAGNEYAVAPAAIHPRCSTDGKANVIDTGIRIVMPGSGGVRMISVAKRPVIADGTGGGRIKMQAIRIIQ